MKPNIKKIKVCKDGYLTICGDVDGFTNGTKEVPLKVPQSLKDALNAFLPTLVDVCRLGDEWDDDGAAEMGYLRVSGVSLKPDTGGTGINITAQLRQDDDVGAYVVVVNSPYLNPERLGSHEETGLAISQAWGKSRNMEISSGKRMALPGSPGGSKAVRNVQAKLRRYQ